MRKPADKEDVATPETLQSKLRVHAPMLISSGEATAMRLTSHLHSGHRILARRMLNECTMQALWKMWVHGRRHASCPWERASKQMGQESDKFSARRYAQQNDKADLAARGSTPPANTSAS
mmetsp:Transcript_7315/g.20238  ORF Transcript_7315/g.20238 Transcript_7315/m.20238 type:complete len:120 (-) Transcript_7315:169-528(-)